MPFDLAAVGEVIEYGVRLAGTAEQALHAVHHPRRRPPGGELLGRPDGATGVTRDHVRKAIDERIERVRMVEEKIQEMIDDGSIMIDTEGSVVGQVNGLSVYQPGRVRVRQARRASPRRPSMGKAGIINIEREAAMSGPSHNKGVLILGGYPPEQLRPAPTRWYLSATHRVRAVVLRRGRRQRLLDGDLRAPLEPLRPPAATGHRRHRAR